MEKTTTTGLLLLKLTPPYPHLILIFPRPRSLSLCHWSGLTKCPSLFSSRSRYDPRSFRPASRWDSGNDKYPGEDPNEKRIWWTEEDPPDAAVKAGSLDLGELIGNLWVIELFKSFGLLLPFVLVPLLQTTGLKAFILMVLGVTLVQALVQAIVLAIEKLSGRPEKRPQRKAKKKQISPRTASNKKTKEDPEESLDAKNGSPGYESWLAADEDYIENGECEKIVSSNFGRWDDLDEPGFVQTPGGSQSRPSGPRKKPDKKAKLSRKERSSSTPLLLRLLIAVFPFLSSWTKML